MSGETNENATGTLRADAMLNVGRIVETARRTLRRSGTATLARIAEDAGVGVATLYRHFPSRRSLADAVMERVWADDVAPLIARFGASGATRADLLRVSEQIIDVFERERGAARAMGDLPGMVAHHLAEDESMRTMLQAARRAGNLRQDLEADELARILAVVTTAPALLDAEAGQRRRLLSLILDGVNPAHAVPLPGSGSEGSRWRTP